MFNSSSINSDIKQILIDVLLMSSAFRVIPSLEPVLVFLCITTYFIPSLSSFTFPTKTLPYQNIHLKL